MTHLHSPFYRCGDLGGILLNWVGCLRGFPHSLILSNDHVYHAQDHVLSTPRTYFIERRGRFNLLSKVFNTLLYLANSRIAILASLAGHANNLSPSSTLYRY